MKNLLILLTSVYPTSTGDMFIHEELKYLQKDFSRILQFTVNATGQAAIRVSPPEGVEFHVNNRRGKAAGILRDIRFMLQRRNYASPDMSYEKEHRVRNFKQLLYLSYAEARARQVVKDSRAIIDQALQEDKYDRVVVYSYWMSIPARAALLIREDLTTRYPGLEIRSYSRGHGYDIYDEASATGFQPFRRALIERMDALFPCSAYGVHYMKLRNAQLGNQLPIYLSRLGIADPLSVRGRSSEDVFLRRQGKPGHLKLVSCNRVVPLKRMSLLVEALYLLRDSGIAIQWTHFGDGSDYEDLKNLCEEKLDFMSWDLRGHVENEKILDFYCLEEIDLFVSVSSTEGVPVSMMEALSACIPVAATDVGGVGEIVLEDRGGKLWHAEVSPAEIAATLKYAASFDPAARQALARQARAVWAELSDASVNYTQMSQVLSGQQPPANIPFTHMRT